jgi:nitroreductase
MNSILDVMKKRRSIRKYLPDQIKDAELAAIIEAGTYAPSGHNCQPWHFTVIQNKELIEYINEKIKQQMATTSQEWAIKSGNSKQYHAFHHAPTVIIISGDKDAQSPIPLAATGHSYTPLVDCAASIQNIMLAAENLGVGSCWLGIVNFFFALPDVKKLDIPTNYQPYFAVTLGYKDTSVVELAAPKRKTNVINYIR